MRAMGLLLLAGILGGCTTVKLSQRNGCWVRETHRTLRGTQEDVGPCVRPPPKWSEDRLTRLVQECVAQADYRWQVRALAAWNRHDPMPAQDSQETVIKTCMNEAAAGVVTQNETLKERLAEISSDRDALRSDASQDAQHLRQSADRLADYLGEAAKRPPPVATATATSTSDGVATSDTGLQADTAATGTLPAGTVVAPTPVVPVATPPAAAAAPGGPTTDAAAPKPARTRSAAAKAARQRALARALRRAECETGRPAGPSPACPAPASAGSAGSRADDAR